MEIKHNKRLSIVKIVVAILLVTLQLSSASCISTDKHKTGTVTEKKIGERVEENNFEKQFRLSEGKYWRRCLLGQEWFGERCNFKPDLEISFNKANESCSDLSADCRVPTKREIVAMLDGCEERVFENGTGKCNSCDKSKICSELYGNNSSDIGLWAIDSSDHLRNATWVIFLDGTVTGRMLDPQTGEPIGAVCVCDKPPGK